MRQNNAKAGDIVRYGGGSTALARLSTRHVGGWHADQCTGGVTYIGPLTAYYLANDEDLRTWEKCAWHRGDGIPPDYRPRIVKPGDFWEVEVKARVPERWAPMFKVYVEQAAEFVNRLNQEIIYAQ